MSKVDMICSATLVTVYSPYMGSEFKCMIHEGHIQKVSANDMCITTTKYHSTALILHVHKSACNILSRVRQRLEHNY